MAQSNAPGGLNKQYGHLRGTEILARNLLDSRAMARPCFLLAALPLVTACASNAASGADPGSAGGDRGAETAAGASGASNTAQNGGSSTDASGAGRSDTVGGGRTAGGSDALGGSTAGGSDAFAGSAAGGGNAPGGSAAGAGHASGGSAAGGGTPVAGRAGDGGAGGARNAGPSCPEARPGQWLAMSRTQTPTPRADAWVIPTDDGMLVWGGLALGGTGSGYVEDGAIYHLCNDSWTPMSTAGAPVALTANTTHPVPPGTWTPTGLVVWGGVGDYATYVAFPEGEAVHAASVYDARTSSWKEMNRAGEPTARDYEARVWTGKELLIWGGVAQSGEKTWVNHQDGALYDPERDRWTPMSTTNAPSGRATMGQTAWTGTQFIVWGGLRFDPGPGFDPAYTTLADGGVYDLASDTWAPLASEGAPTGPGPVVLWTGSKLLVLAVLDGHTTPGVIDFDGALYDPASNSWAKMSAPDPSLVGAFVWRDGSRKAFWAGSTFVLVGERVDDAATPRVSYVTLVYDPARDQWRGADLPASPGYGSWQVAQVVDGKVLYGSSVMGPDQHASTQLVLFDPETMAFSALPALARRGNASVVSSAHHVLVWGGQDTYPDLDAPDPCENAPLPCDPITPTKSDPLDDGMAFGL
jgi:hypothetical protein